MGKNATFLRPPVDILPMKKITTTKGNVEHPSSTLRSVLYRLLIPVVKICIRCGLTHQQLHSITREVFLEGAREELLKTRGKATVSQLSLLTGLSRKEVNRIEKVYLFL